MPVIKAILFDLGGTVWDDYPMELYQWELLARLLEPFGVETCLAQLILLAHEVVKTYSPSVTRAMIFRLLDGDVEKYRIVVDQLVEHMKAQLDDPEQFRRLNVLYEGTHEMLENLARHFPLGVVSQHFSEVERWMRVHKVEGYFRQFSLSGREKIYKPDPRIFLHCCEALGVAPENALMIGDRLDNDIWPANRLNMTTVRVMAEPYSRQQPRYHADVPDHTLQRAAELPALLARLGAL